MACMLYVCVSVHVGGGGGVNGRVDVWVDIGVSGGGVFCVCVLCKWVCVLRCWEGSLGLWQVGLSGAALPPAC